MIRHQLRQLINAVDKIANGNYEVPINTDLTNEMGDLARALDSMRCQLPQFVSGSRSSSSMAHYRSIVETMLDALIVADAGGMIRLCNPAVTGVFGYNAEEMIGQNLTMLMPESYRGLHDGYLQRYLKTKVPHILGERRVSEFEGQHKDGRTFPMTLIVNEFQTDDEVFFNAIVRDISEEVERNAELRWVVAAVESAADAIGMYELNGKLVYANRAYSEHTGWDLDSCVGMSAWELQTSDNYHEIVETVAQGHIWSGRIRTKMRNDRWVEEEGKISPVTDEAGVTTHYVSVMHDVTKQIETEQQLAQAQKLESIGQLAAGIAHEINTPIQFVGDNTRFIKDAFEDVNELFETLSELQASANGSVPIQALGEALEKTDVGYLKAEVPRALEQSIEGIDRVAKIVLAMKEFSHPGQEKTLVDLNEAIQSTLTVATNEWKYVADMRTDFDLALPLVSCLPGAFNQVILNIIVNASHAIIDVLGDSSENKGVITITTRQVEDWAEIRITDTGGGMPEGVKARVFDPFFTTKDVGKGTGQGLSIAHDVVVNKHSGTIRVDSQPGEGTCFTIRLPIDARHA